MQDPKQVAEAKRALMDANEKGEPLPEEALKLITEVFGSAKAFDPCPCGKGIPFGNCCKLDWMVLQRAAKGDVKKSDDGNGKDKGEEGIRWVCQVGRDPRGNPVIRPLGAGVKRDPIEVAAELLLAYHALTINTLFEATSQMVGQAMQAARPTRLPPRLS